MSLASFRLILNARVLELILRMRVVVLRLMVRGIFRLCVSVTPALGYEVIGLLDGLMLSEATINPAMFVLKWG